MLPRHDSLLFVAPPGAPMDTSSAIKTTVATMTLTNTNALTHK